jgi:hypothetical protein
MKKFFITESQYLGLKRYLIESKLRTYVFDWDDNILKMPTKIKMDKLVNNKWVPIDVSTEEFAHVRTDKNYRLRDNDPDKSFSSFKENKPFIEDTKTAIHNGSFAPSYKKFIEALTYANPFAINTARGHSPNTLKDGVKVFIDMVLTDEEKREMLTNISKTLPSNLIKGLNEKQLIDLYLDERGEFYPVSSDEFGERFGLDVKKGASSPEHSKKIAIEHFVKKILSNVKEHLINGDYKKISLGFSDDDIKNVKSVESFINDELKKMYPEVHFVIYDTSLGDKKKMVIEKE